MTTPTNARQTSERERLAEWLETLAGLGDMGRKPDVKDKHRMAAAQLRADERLDAELAALRAEVVARGKEIRERMDDLEARRSEIKLLRSSVSALRTVTDDDVASAKRAFVSADPNFAPAGKAVRAMLESFIRSKESRRG